MTRHPRLRLWHATWGPVFSRRMPQTSRTLVVVAAPPDVVAAVVAQELTQWPDAVVTDAASVKGSVLTALRDTRS